MLGKFQTISDSELNKINGGGKADYNFGYSLGHGLYKWFKTHF